MLGRMNGDGLGDVATEQKHGLSFSGWQRAPEKDIVQAGFRDAEGDFGDVRNPAPVCLQELMILAILGMGNGWGEHSFLLSGLMKRQRR